MTLNEIRAAVAAHGPRARGRLYAAELREAVRSHVAAGRSRGQSWSALAAETGLREATLQYWVAPPSTSKSALLVPVVAARSQTQLRIRTACGAVLEGLDVDTAVRILRALG